MSTENGKRLAEDYGIPFFETSAKSSDNINEGFYKLAEVILEKVHTCS